MIIFFCNFIVTNLIITKLIITNLISNINLILPSNFILLSILKSNLSFLDLVILIFSKIFIIKVSSAII